MTAEQTEAVQDFTRSLPFQSREYIAQIIEFITHDMKATTDFVELLWIIMGLFGRYFNLFMPMFLMIITGSLAVVFLPPKQAKYTFVLMNLMQSFLMGLAAYKFFYAY